MLPAWRFSGYAGLNTFPGDTCSDEPWHARWPRGGWDCKCPGASFLCCRGPDITGTPGQMEPENHLEWYHPLCARWDQNATASPYWKPCLAPEVSGKAFHRPPQAGPDRSLGILTSVRPREATELLARWSAIGLRKRVSGRGVVCPDSRTRSGARRTSGANSLREH